MVVTTTPAGIGGPISFETNVQRAFSRNSLHTKTRPAGGRWRLSSVAAVSRRLIPAADGSGVGGRGHLIRARHSDVTAAAMTAPTPSHGNGRRRLTEPADTETLGALIHAN